MKILIVEDNAQIMKTLELCLTRNEHELILCRDGNSAMAKIKSQNPDIIIVDIMLPNFLGLSILNAVKQSDNAVPVIVISACNQQVVMDKAVKLGADAFISKPFNLNLLTFHITRLTQNSVAA